MHKRRLGEITIDCQTENLESAVDFWAAALGLEPEEHDGHYHLKTESNELRVNVQLVEHESRVHIDLETDNIEAEVKRLEALGAKQVREGARWVVMRTPTGHGLCVCNISRSGFEEEANRWD